MAYTRPDGGAADFSFLGDAYTRPDGDAATLGWAPPVTHDLTFQPSDPYTLPTQTAANFVFDVPKTGTATGFNLGVLGTPNATLDQSEDATGFTSTAFGQPAYVFVAQADGFLSTVLGDARVTTIAAAAGWNETAFGDAGIHYNAVGFSGTAFGTHAAPYAQAGQAVGWLAANIGTPSRVSLTRAASFGPLAVIPGAFTRQDQTAEARGFTPVRFGRPIYRVAPDITENITCAASGWRVAVFGTPEAPRAQEAQAYGFCYTRLGAHRGYEARPSTEFGTPKARTTHAAEGFAAALFGAPLVPFTAVGFGSTALGLPVAAASNTASGFCRTRMGTHWSAVKGHRVYTLRVPARFGRPRATLAFNRTATGFGGAQFGTPVGACIQRALHIAPVATFGTAILKRSPAC